MQSIPGVKYLFLAMAILLFACNAGVQSASEPADLAPEGGVVVQGDVGITMSILFCTADDFDAKVVCIEGPNADRCPNCQAIGNRPPNPPANKPPAKRGNLLLKYVIENNTFNLYGWSYNLKDSDRSRDFDELPNIKMTIGSAIPGVEAKNGTQLGDLIWSYNTMAKVYCENQGPNRKRYILLVPGETTHSDGTKQVKWLAFKTNINPASGGFVLKENDITNFEQLDGAPNPIPPKSFNTEWGDN